MRGVFDRTTGQANLLIVPINENKQPLDQQTLNRAARIEGVEIAAPSIRGYTLLASDANSWQIAFNMTGVAEGNFFQIYGIDPELDSEVRVYVLESGRMPRPDKYEAVIPSEFAAEKELKIGDDLSILVDQDGRYKTSVESLEIVGLLAAEGVAMLNDGAIGFTSLSVAQDILGRSGEMDEIALRLSPALSENPNALDAYKKELGLKFNNQARVVYPAARGQLVGQMLATYQMGLTFFSIISIFVGAFLIYNAFSMTVVERTREIGMLRAVGMNRSHVLRLVLAEAVLLSLIGSAIGMIAGYWLAQGLIVLLGDLTPTQNSVLSISPSILFQSLAVGIGVTLVAALIPALQAAHISPLEALRSRSRGLNPVKPAVWIAGLVLLGIGWYATYQINWPVELIYLGGNISMVCFFLGATLTVSLAVSGLERLARPIAILIYGTEGALGTSNVRRSVGRTTLTVAALMVSLAMIISIESLAFSFETDMKNWIDNALGGDLYVRAPLPMRESFANKLEDVPGVEIVSPARLLSVSAAAGSLSSDTDADSKFYYEAIEPTTFLQMGDMEFAANQGDPQANWNRLVEGKAVFISSTVADRYNLRQGDQIILLTRRGEQPFEIAAEVMDFGGQGQVIYGTYSDMQRWFNEKGVDRFTIKVDQGYSVESVGAEIEARFKDSEHISIQTTEAFKNSILDLMTQSFQLFDVLNLIGVIIGALGVINTLTMNVIERTREIGGLRSLGMTRSQVLRMVLSEALALGMMGGIYGMAVGYVIANVTIMGTNLMIGYDLVYRFTINPYFTGALIALGVVQLAAIYPARRAARVNIVEAIKHE